MISIPQVDWTEPFIIGLVSFHVISLIFILATRHIPILQTITFIVLGSQFESWIISVIVTS